jgi:hypothetical protein
VSSNRKVKELIFNFSPSSLYAFVVYITANLRLVLAALQMAAVEAQINLRDWSGE